jgi:hypothetical protein
MVEIVDEPRGEKKILKIESEEQRRTVSDMLGVPCDPTVPHYFVRVVSTSENGDGDVFYFAEDNPHVHTGVVN